jgi:O-antigen/teichoic acid export membrane protein
MGAGRLTRKIGIVAVGRAASALSIIAVNAIVARAWSVEECGLFGATWFLGNTLVPIFLLGLPTSLLYFFPLRTNRGALVGQALGCLLASGLLLSATLYFFGPHISQWLEGGLARNHPITPYLWPIIPYLFSIVVGGFVEAALVASDREIGLAWLNLAMGASLVAAALGALFLGLRPEQTLALFSGLGLGRLATGFWLVRRALGGQSWWDWAGLGEFLRYARPIGFNDAVGSLSRFVDRFVVGYFFAAGTFAQYHFGAIEVPVSLLLAAIVSVLVPEISRLYQDRRLDEIQALWQRAVSRLALVVLPLAAFLLVFADPFIGWIFPAGYARSAWVFRLYLLVLPLRCAIYNPLLVGMGKARWALWGSLGDLGCNVVLSLALVHYLLEVRPEWAFLGPAVATVCSTYFQVAFLLAAIGGHLHWSLRRILPWGRLLRIGAFAGGAALASRWVTSGLSGELLQLMAGGICFLVAMGGLVWTNPGDRAELREVFAAFSGRDNR